MITPTRKSRLARSATIIGAASGVFAMVGVVHQVFYAGSAAEQREQSNNGGVNMGDSNEVGQLVINNYNSEKMPSSLPVRADQQQSYAEGSLDVRPLECVNDATDLNCNLRITVLQEKSFVWLQGATFDSVNGRPYRSVAVGFEGDRSRSTAAKSLPKDVPTVVYARFSQVPPDAQQGTLFIPVRVGSNEDTIRVTVEKRG